MNKEIIYPQNSAYIKGTSLRYEPMEQNSSKQMIQLEQGYNSVQSTNILTMKIEHLERQLNELTKYLSSEEGQDAHLVEEITRQNAQLKQMLKEQSTQMQEIVSQNKSYQQTIEEYKSSLFELNQEFEALHREHQGCKNLNQSNISKATNHNTTHLQEDIVKLNEEIENLLSKLHALHEDYNEEQNAKELILNQLNEQNLLLEKLRNQNMHLESKSEESKMENQYLKEEIKKVSEIAMNQQEVVQEKYIQQAFALEQDLQNIKQSCNHLSNQNTLLKAEKNSQNPKETEFVTEIRNLKEKLLQRQENQKETHRKFEESILRVEAQKKNLEEDLYKVKMQLKNIQKKQQKFANVQEENDRSKRGFSLPSKMIDSEQYKNIIIRLEREKEEYFQKIQHLEIQLLQSQSDKNYSKLSHELKSKNQQLIDKVTIFEQKYLVLKGTTQKYERQIAEYQSVFHQLERNNEKLREQNQEISSNYLHLENNILRDKTVENKIERNQFIRHKIMYEELVKKYDKTALEHHKLEIKLKQFQEQLRIQTKNKEIEYKNGKSSRKDYNSDDSDLIKLQNSSLRSQIKELNKENEKVKSILKNQEELLIREKGRIREIQQKMNEKIEEFNQKYLQQRNKPTNSYYDYAHQERIQQNKIIISLEDKVEHLSREIENKNREISTYRSEVETISKRNHPNPNPNLNLNPNPNPNPNNMYCEKESSSPMTQFSNYNKEHHPSNYNIKHHPEVKKLQGEVIALERSLMENNLKFKKEYSLMVEEIDKLRVQNTCHRNKIEQLHREDNDNKTIIVEYNKIIKNMELLDLKMKQYENQLTYKNKKIQILERELQKTTREDMVHHSNRTSHHILEEEKQNLKKEIFFLKERLDLANNDMRILDDFVDAKINDNFITPRGSDNAINKSQWLIEKLLHQIAQFKQEIQRNKQQVAGQKQTQLSNANVFSFSQQSNYQIRHSRNQDDSELQMIREEIKKNKKKDLLKLNLQVHRHKYDIREEAATIKGQRREILEKLKKEIVS